MYGFFSKDVITGRMNLTGTDFDSSDMLMSVANVGARISMLSINQSINQSINLSIYLSIYLSLFGIA